MVEGAASHLSYPVQIGDLVDKYRVERVVGVGAMGLVVAARHTTLDQPVAIKFLLARSGDPRFGSPDEAIARFLAEARAAARIESDHVCRVSDVGMTPGGVPYMVLEHLQGHDLEEEIVARGQVDLIEGVDYVLQALDAMAAAHRLGVVHRDLKPANLFLAERPDGSRRVKVLDFGISKAMAMSQQRLTRETNSLGTPAYMPPEQIRDPRNVDHRADLWALGAILYELLTGQMAFAGESVGEVLDRVLGEAPCPISALRRDAPPELVAVIDRALARDRDHRWPSAAAFARALAPFGSVGVLAGLASIQREVGSLSSISSISAAAAARASMPMPATPAAAYVPAVPGSVEPVVAALPRETLPDPSELSRRHVVAQDWAALQTRRRRARAAVLGMSSVLLVGAAIAILAYRIHAAPRAGDASSSAASAAVMSPARAPEAPSASDAGTSPAAPTAPALNVHSAPHATPTARPRRPRTSKPRRRPGARP